MIPRNSAIAPEISDKLALATPGSYESEASCARVIAQYIEQMPLREMAVRSNELVLLKNSASSRRDREIIEVLASAKRQLAKISARYEP